MLFFVPKLMSKRRVPYYIFLLQISIAGFFDWLFFNIFLFEYESRNPKDDFEKAQDAHSGK